MDNRNIPYVVEPMTLADVPAVAVLEKTVFSLPWSRYAFEYEVQHNPMAHFLVLRLRETAVARQESHTHPRIEVAGTAPVGPSRHPLLGYGGFWLAIDEAHICTLAVHPNWRGRGLGELLLVHLLDRATEVNAAVVTLEVRASNLLAQELYGKYGFLRIGLHKGYYSDNGEDAVIMAAEHISSAAFQGQLQELKSSLWQKLAAQKHRPHSV